MAGNPQIGSTLSPNLFPAAPDNDAKGDNSINSVGKCSPSAGII